MIISIILFLCISIVSLCSLLYGIIYRTYLPDDYFIFYGIVGLFIDFFIIYFRFPSIIYDYPKNNVSDFVIPYKKVDNMDFYVSKKKNIYTIKFDKYMCDLNLKGFVFPLLYVKSFIIRNIRFIEISNRLPIRTLWKRKIKMTYCKIKNANIIYKNKKIKIVKNSVSKANLIDNFINLSAHHGYFPSYSRYDRPFDANNNILKLNEKLYVVKNRNL